MSGNTYKQICYHIIFSTKDRHPVINSEIRSDVYNYIRRMSKEIGLYLHNIGGTDDHVHLLIYIPPKLAVSDAVGKLKGASSHYVNSKYADKYTLYWQNGFGAFTIGKERFKRLATYIDNQEKHHRDETIEDDLEKVP